jgi:heptosyltransferase-3
VRLLFITANRVGDAVLTTGILNQLIVENPGIRVTVACGPAGQTLFSATPGLERVIPLVKRPFVGHWVGLWREIAAMRWDIAVDLRGSATTMMLRVGRRHIWRGAPEVGARVAQLGRFMGYDPPPAPRLWLSERARRVAAGLIPPGPPALALGPIANWAGKQWPLDRFAALTERLTSPIGPLAGARIAIFGAPHEHAAAEPLRRTLPPDRLIDVMSQSDLLVVAAALERCALYVGNDSGLMHMAAAVGAPTLGLFGPSDDRAYGPWGPLARAVRCAERFDTLLARGKSDSSTLGSLMDGLSVDQVERSAIALLAEAGKVKFTISS